MGSYMGNLINALLGRVGSAAPTPTSKTSTTTSRSFSEPDSPRFCIDCKHIDYIPADGFEMAKCKKTKVVSAVTGAKSYSGAPITYCSLLREYSSGYIPRCGPNADWYEPK